MYCQKALSSQKLYNQAQRKVYCTFCCSANMKSCFPFINTSLHSDLSKTTHSVDIVATQSPGLIHFNESLIPFKKGF